MVGDQIGAPTWCESIAEATVAVLGQADGDWVRYIGSNSGLYNMTCGGATSWFGFADAIRSHLATLGTSEKLPAALNRAAATSSILPFCFLMPDRDRRS